MFFTECAVVVVHTDHTDSRASLLVHGSDQIKYCTVYDILILKQLGQQLDKLLIKCIKAKQPFQIFVRVFTRILHGFHLIEKEIISTSMKSHPVYLNIYSLQISIASSRLCYWKLLRIASENQTGTEYSRVWWPLERVVCGLKVGW